MTHLISRRRFVATGAASLCSPTVLRGGVTKIELNLMLDCSGSMFKTAIPGISSSIPSDKYQVQRDGHAEGLLSVEVREFLQWHKVHVRVYGWSNIPVLHCERVVESFADVDWLAVQVAGMDLYDRLSAGATLHDQAVDPFTLPPPLGIRRVIDISTDEPPWSERIDLCLSSRDLIYGARGTVNVLAINPTPEMHRSLLDSLVTPDGFIEEAKGLGDYHRAIKAKLIGELL